MSSPSKTVNFKLLSSGKQATKYHVAQFTQPLDLEKLPQPVTMSRRVQVIEPKKPSFGNRPVYEQAKQDPKTYPFVLKDGKDTTSTGIFEDIPGTYMVLVKEGTAMRAYPVQNWFRFGFPKEAVPENAEAQPVPRTIDSVVSRMDRTVEKLLSGLEAEEPKVESRAKATGERKSMGASEDGQEDGEAMDYDEDFADDEGINAPEDDTEDANNISLPKKLNKTGRKLAEAVLQQQAEEGTENDFTFLYDFIDQINDSDEEELDDQDEAAEGPSKKRKASDQLDERPSKKPKLAKGISPEKRKENKRAIRDAFKVAFGVTPTLSLPEMYKICRQIPTFAIPTNSDKNLTPEETELRQYWAQLWSEVISEYLEPKGKRYQWKKK